MMWAEFKQHFLFFLSLTADLYVSLFSTLLSLSLSVLVPCLPSRLLFSFSLFSMLHNSVTPPLRRGQVCYCVYFPFSWLAFFLRLNSPCSIELLFSLRSSAAACKCRYMRISLRMHSGATVVSFSGVWCIFLEGFWWCVCVWTRRHPPLFSCLRVVFLGICLKSVLSERSTVFYCIGNTTQPFFSSWLL